MISQSQFSTIISNIIKISNTEGASIEDVLGEAEEIINNLSSETFISLMFNDYEKQKRNIMDFKNTGYLIMWAEVIKEDHIEEIFKAEKETNQLAFNFPLLLLNIFNFFKDEKKYAVEEGGFEENDDYIKEVERLMDKSKKIMDSLVINKK